MIRRILYPSEVVFRYRKHTVLFILLLVLAAPISFTISFINWESYKVGTWENILRSLEIITVLVPGLQVFLTLYLHIRQYYYVILCL